MKVQVNGEVIEVQPRTDGKIFKILHTHADGTGKEVVDMYCGYTDKKGNKLSVPDLKIGGMFKGIVRFNGLCFQA